MSQLAGLPVAAVAAMVGCMVPTGPAGEPQPQPGQSFATVSTSNEQPVSEPVAPPDPFAGRPCPEDMAIDVGPRKIDGRDPSETIRVRYAKEHLKPVGPNHVLPVEEAIDRVLAFEAERPGLIPAGFRAELADHRRDPAFRLFMARCELDVPRTVRRAGYDAGLAYLLGAAREVVHPLVKDSFYPDGGTVMSCTVTKDCGGDGMFCDKVERSCRSSTWKTAAFLSAAELDVEDTLVRGFASLLTPEMIARDGYDPDDLIGTFSYGRFVKCSGALCNFTRYAKASGTVLVHWDRRYRGESYGGASEDVLTGDAKECFDHTEAADLDQCTYRCGQGAVSKEAACITRCQAWCR